ncbi:MAG: tRNA (cytidine(34)-2'-O)-methyltransferase [Verrucomicrobia bacterium]|nr:MAG: tRNA (cytidine(34)-2'-O)-methyltransferase [Verrucomicrobiota bacterium]
MHVVLLEPEIPPNTGNIARLCAGTGATLHLVEPLGFDLDERRLQRAGMDYWQLVRWHRWRDWDAFRASCPPDARLWFVEQGAPRGYHEVRYARGDYLVFGRESAGLPRTLLEANRPGWIDLPMPNAAARSLNLSNCAAIVLFEALRQTGFGRD